MIFIISQERVSFDATIRLLSYDLEVTGSNLGSYLSVCRGKVACIYPSQSLPSGSLVYRTSLLIDYKPRSNVKARLFNFVYSAFYISALPRKYLNAGSITGLSSRSSYPT